jgi:outer membrane murein-binding lipoprotein Lpp
MNELFNELGYVVLSAIVFQILTNIVVVAVLKNQVQNLKERINDAHGTATRAHARIDDVNSFLRSQPNR